MSTRVLIFAGYVPAYLFHPRICWWRRAFNLLWRFNIFTIFFSFCYLEMEVFVLFFFILLWGTELFFGILFHTHCSRYLIMLNSAEPYLITGKNTNTNLFSTCNTHPPPPPYINQCALFYCSLLLETPAIRDSNPVGESTNINNTNNTKNAMQDKTRVKHRYLQEFWKLPQRHLCAILMNCYIRRRNRVHFFGKAKSPRENKMKKTSEQDSGFVPRKILIWKCAKPSKSVRSAVKTQQQILTTVCKMYFVCKMQLVGCPNSRLVHIFAAAFDWRILPPYQNTLA